jgi:tripartite-type tricarboxylate transporter receptor subunit TctC
MVVSTKHPVHTVAELVALAKANPGKLTYGSLGKGRGIAATSAACMVAAPDIPTFIEAGAPGFEIDGWYGIVGPPAMPANIVDKLSAEMARAVKLPEAGAVCMTAFPAEIGDIQGGMPSHFETGP